MRVLRYMPFLVAIGVAYCQTPDQRVHQLAGCYDITSLSSNSRDKNIAVIPKQIELREEPRRDAFAFQSTVRQVGPNFENLWTWEPRGNSKIAISFSHGLGGVRGTLKRSSDGELTGMLKEWCDFRCDYERWIGTVRLHKISCQ